MKLELIPCPTCGDVYSEVYCPTCLGNGCVPVDTEIDMNACPECGGAGHVDDEQCVVCQAQGYVTVAELPPAPCRGCGVWHDGEALSDGFCCCCKVMPWEAPAGKPEAYDDVIPF